MLAHRQCGLLNVAQLARKMSVNAKTAQSYIDLLCALLLVWRLLRCAMAFRQFHFMRYVWNLAFLAQVNANAAKSTMLAN